MNSPSPNELAREAREALSKSKETSHERFQRLIRLGWINSRGEVTRLLGGDAEPEPGQPSLHEDSEGGPPDAERNGH